MVKEADFGREAADAGRRVRDMKQRGISIPDVGRETKDVATRQQPQEPKLTREQKRELKIKKEIEDRRLKLQEEQKRLEELKAQNAKAKEIQKQEKRVKKAQEALDKAREKYGKSLTADQLAKNIEKNRKEMEKNGLEPDKDKKDGKDDDVRRREQEMQKKYSNIQLPDGMRIVAEGSQWTLYDKNNRPKDVTSEMNEFVRANKQIDAANHTIDRNNAEQTNAATPATDGKLPGQEDAMANETVRKVDVGQLPQITAPDGAELPREVLTGNGELPGLAGVAAMRALDEVALERLGKRLNDQLEEKDRDPEEARRRNIERAQQYARTQNTR